MAEVVPAAVKKARKTEAKAIFGFGWQILLFEKICLLVKTWIKKKEVRGREIVFGTDGTPTGFLKEQAGTYTRSFLDNDNLFSVDLAKTTLLDIEKHLLSEG